MGNTTGIVWYRKTQKQKQRDVQKHFIDSKIRTLQNRINNIEKEIIDCRGKIGKFKILIRPLLVQEETLRTKNKIKEIKEKIKEVQSQIIQVKARRKGQENRAKTSIERAIEKYKETLLTKEQMISIIKTGTIYEDK